MASLKEKGWEVAKAYYDRQRQIDIIWAAGFIDGEGCINIIKRCPTTGWNQGKYYHSISLSANQISKEPLLRLQKLFGGSIHATKPIGNRRPSFGWIAYTKAARTALEEMLPYFSVKGLEAEKVLSLDFSNRRVSSEEWEKREEVEAFLKNHHATYVWTEGAGD